MIIIGQHRSQALADRHLRDIRREHPDSTVQETSRRNARGRFSMRGHFFTFEVIDHPEKLELVAHFDYGGGRKSNLIEFQLHIFAPRGTSDEDAIKTIRQRARGVPWPKGWKAKTLRYASGTKGWRANKGKDKLPKGLINRSISAGDGAIEQRIPRKNSIRSDRHSGDKAK